VNILVTGAGGFLGLYITKMLLSRGYAVTNFSRSNHPELDKLGVKTILGDVANLEDVKVALKGQDAVFHVASKIGMWGKWSDFERINIGGVKNIIKCCKEYKIQRLVYTSTPSVAFGKKELCGVDESTPIPRHHLNFYAKSKAIAEKLILKANDSKDLCSVALRPHLIFGPGDTNLIPTVVKSAKSGRLQIVGDGKNLVDVIFVENAADAHLKAFDALTTGAKVCGKAYFLGQEQPVVLWDFINEILKRSGVNEIERCISVKSAYAVGALLESSYALLGKRDQDPPMTRFLALQLGKSHYFSHANAKRDFGYQVKVSTQEGVDRLFSYFPN
jgi:nucleoside-diphosphate-sugar epimerase